jgi:hypothetical protein
MPPSLDNSTWRSSLEPFSVSTGNPTFPRTAGRECAHVGSLASSPIPSSIIGHAFVSDHCWGWAGLWFLMSLAPAVRRLPHPSRAFCEKGGRQNVRTNGTNHIVSAASPPALAKDARTTHAELWCGKEKAAQDSESNTHPTLLKTTCQSLSRADHPAHPRVISSPRRSPSQA